MGKSIQARVCTVPFDDIDYVEGFAFESLHMTKEKALGRFSEPYENTLAECKDQLECKGMYDSFEIIEKRDDAIVIEDGTVIESPMLASMMDGADELVMYAVVVHGIDELSKDPENSMMETMFYDAWGIGFSMAGHRILKKMIADEAHASGRFIGRGWTPGEDDLEISHQKTLFRLLDTQEIGLELHEPYLMRPIMSVSGFMAVSDDEAIESLGAELGECH